jgi:hypothetical protein
VNWDASSETFVIDAAAQGVGSQASPLRWALI